MVYTTTAEKTQQNYLVFLITDLTRFNISGYDLPHIFGPIAAVKKG
jgi:hypothetical protein